ncbi:hypothetical protein Lfu02_42490 [Longispora fulva]|nr:hypothetical protein Lfu02_42490 [Longispora fulva]
MPHAHLVRVTKYRAPVFTDTHLAYLEQIMRDVRAEFEREPVEQQRGQPREHCGGSWPQNSANRSDPWRRAAR